MTTADPLDRVGSPSGGVQAVAAGAPVRRLVAVDAGHNVHLQQQEQVAEVVATLSVPSVLRTSHDGRGGRSA
jgi:pimeloyl-ACP methyl ester carboxylesterase